MAESGNAPDYNTVIVIWRNSRWFPKGSLGSNPNPGDILKVRIPGLRVKEKADQSAKVRFLYQGNTVIEWSYENQRYQ